MNISDQGSGSDKDLTMGRDGAFFVLRARLFLPLAPEAVFPFFADARNLESITPSWLHFEIISPLPVRMRTGAGIEADRKNNPMFLKISPLSDPFLILIIPSYVN